MCACGCVHTCVPTYVRSCVHVCTCVHMGVGRVLACTCVNQKDVPPDKQNKNEGSGRGQTRANHTHKHTLPGRLEVGIRHCLLKEPELRVEHSQCPLQTVVSCAFSRPRPKQHRVPAHAVSESCNTCSEPCARHNALQHMPGYIACLQPAHIVHPCHPQHSDFHRVQFLPTRCAKGIGKPGSMFAGNCNSTYRHTYHQESFLSHRPA